MNRLTKVYEDGNEKAEYEYNDDGTLKKASYGSQTTDYSYNLANLLTEVNNANGGTQISKYSYTYYVDGNQKSKTESVDGSNKGTTDYTYDGLNRLIKEQAPDKTYSYQYDSYGNRSQLSVTGDETYTTNYSYDKNNRLRNQTKIAGSVSEITDYWYDPNGNQISSMTVTTGGGENAVVGIEPAGGNTNSINEYDSWNQLTKTMQNGKTASYTYNGDGLRMSKTVDGTTTSHIWDGMNIAGDVTNGTVTKYIRGIQLISSKTDSNESFYTYNAHGDVVQLTNGSGDITKQYSYDAFGVEQNKDVNDTNPFRYCGEYFDSETESVYLRARYYSPVSGRFITEDPVKDGLNWYSYCGGNPAMFVDPSGYIYDYEQDMYENGEMSPGAYSFLMVCTYQYYLSDTQEGKDWWNAQAENFRNSGYTDTGNEYWNWTLTQMDSKPSGEEISEEEHYFRNCLNIQFEWDEFEKLNERLPEDLKWRELPWYQSIFHKFSLDTAWQGNNRKYVSACEHFEVVYTKENYLVDEEFNSTYMGTYNYYGPTQAEEHKKYDVDPYFEYGNVK